MNLKQNLEQAKLEIASTARKYEKDPFKIKLVAVTKTVPAHIVSEAINLGVKDIGESYVQEALEKFPKIKNIKKARTHLVGHLQSNKAKKAVQLFDVIHSVDSTKLARKLSKHCLEYNKIIDVFIEVNVSGEKSKFGAKEEDLTELVEYVRELKNLNLIGLMTIAPEGKDPFPYFNRLRELAHNFNLNELSIGMTNDFKAAIQADATYVRIGTLIFGERKPL